MLRIAVIILNWNGKEDTLACLETVTSINYPSYQAVVVDNGSSDDSVAAFHKAFPEVTVLETGTNLGYAGGNNVGIRWALDQGFDGILVLNNDTVVDRNILQAFTNAQNLFPQAGVFGAKIYYYDQPDILWFAGGIWQPDTLEFDHVGKDQPDSLEFSVPKTFDYMTGCAIYAPADVFRSVGLFGDDFFLTYEETDWCYRARKKGFTPTYIPEAKLWHKVSASFGGAISPLMIYFLTRNRLLFVRRHMSTMTFIRLFITLIEELRITIFPHISFFIKDIRPTPRQIYWALLAYKAEVTRRIKIPATYAKIYGVHNFCTKRLGDCPSEIRSIPRTINQTQQNHHTAR